MSAKSNEIHLTRVYDAPVQVVWDAWTDPEQVAKWWGPRGFTLTTHSKDLRPGGYWDYTMHGPDGTDYMNKTVYHEVEPYRKLVYDHGGHDDRPPLFRVTVLFSESNGKTTMEMTMALPSPEQMVAIKKIIKDASGYSTWDRLAEYLSETESGRACFVINRSFAATAEQVFDLWTDPQHLANWLPPAGFEMEFRRAEIREGGSSFFQMKNPAGVSFCGLFLYRDIARPHRIVYEQRFCDESEKPSRHPGMPVFPNAFLVTVLFVPEEDDATRVTVTFEPEGPTTAEELQAFLQARMSMTQGWNGSFDQLESMLEERMETAT